MANSVGYHESEDKLRPETQDKHRALTSAMEELEAIDWYDQRIDATADDELRQILIHNRDDEKEHAALVLAWLVKHDAVLARELSTKLVAGEGPDDEAQAPTGDGTLGIGSLRGRT